MSNSVWSRKEELCKLATQHTKYMQDNYADRINSSIKEAIVLSSVDPRVLHASSNAVDTHISVIDTDSVSAAFMYPSEDVAILDFASYKQPGGMFREGSRAQEECLCHASDLYNILSSEKLMASFYRPNIDNGKTFGLNGNRMIIVPKVLYIPSPQQQREFTTIICAAPNKKAAMKYFNVAPDVCDGYMYDRINYMMQTLAAVNMTANLLPTKINTLILGAFGCGVFGNDPRSVAAYFKYVLDNIVPNAFQNIVFAIPDYTSENYKVFVDVLLQKE